MTNLSLSVTSGHLKELFAPLNTLFLAKIMRCELSDRTIASRGFGHVSFTQMVDRNEAYEWLQSRLDYGATILDSP